MKKIFTAIVIMSLVAVFNCTKDKDMESKEILGGFEKLDVSSEIAVKSFGFLKSELKKSNPDIKLLMIKKAETQVVAGTNVGLTCEYMDKKGDKRTLYAKIYVSLENKYELTELKLDL